MPDTNVNPHEATRPGPGQNPPAVSTNSSSSSSSGSGFDHREAVRVQEAERRRAEREAARREEERQREELMEDEAGGHHEVVDPAVRQARADALARAARERDARIAARRREEEAARNDEEARQRHARLVPSFSPTAAAAREEWVEEEAGGRGTQPAPSAAVAQARRDADHQARLDKARREKAAEDTRRERELRERTIASDRERRRKNRASEAAFEERLELAEMGSQPAPSPDVAQARESALVRAERERLQRAFPLVPIASPGRLPDGGPRGRTFLAGDHLANPGAVIEDPSTGQPAQDPSEGKTRSLRDTVRDDELQPISEGGKMAANLLATQGGGDSRWAGADTTSREDDFRQDISKDEALWRREGDVLTAAFALDSAGSQLKAAEKRLDNVQREIEVFSALDKPFSNLDPDSAIAKEGARRYQQNIDQLQQELDGAQADYDSAQTALSDLKEATEAAGVQITPAHWQYVEDRKPEPESFAFFFPLGTRSINLFNDARRPDSDGGIDVTKEEAKAISLAQIGDVVARSGSASTFIGGPGLVFNAGKGIIRGGALSKPLMGQILKEAPMEALEELGFQGSDILFYKEQFDLPGFAGEVAVESFLQGAGTFAPGRRTSGGAGAGTSAGPPVMTADQLTALLSSTNTGKETLAAIKQGSSTGL